MSSEVLLTPASRAPTAAFQYSEDGHGWDAPDSSAHGLGSGGGGGGICCCCGLTHLVGACGSCRAEGGISGGSGLAGLLAGWLWAQWAVLGKSSPGLSRSEWQVWVWTGAESPGPRGLARF